MDLFNKAKTVLISMDLLTKKMKINNWKLRIIQIKSMHNNFKKTIAINNLIRMDFSILMVKWTKTGSLYLQKVKGRMLWIKLLNKWFNKTLRASRLQTNHHLKEDKTNIKIIEIS
jgi:hypothetical protein